MHIMKHHNKKNLLVFIVPPLRLKCITYRGDKLISHTLKLYKKFTERRLKQETHDFMPGRSTMERPIKLKT